MVEIILSDDQLRCLKQAVPSDSPEFAALAKGERLGSSSVMSPEPIAVMCASEVATRLLSVAQESCPDIVPEIRAALEASSEATATPVHGLAARGAVTLRLRTERLRKAVALLADHHPEAIYPQVWRALNAELGRRTGGAAWRPIVIDARYLAGLPFVVKETLQLGV
jgi:hypothetical protein